MKLISLINVERQANQGKSIYFYTGITDCHIQPGEINLNYTLQAMISHDIKRYFIRNNESVESFASINQQAAYVSAEGN